jgi:hypothetical protein
LFEVLIGIRFRTGYYTLVPEISGKLNEKKISSELIDQYGPIYTGFGGCNFYGISGRCQRCSAIIGGKLDRAFRASFWLWISP